MDSTNTSHHISHKFDEEMESLRNQVLKMGGLVEQQISGAIERCKAPMPVAQKKSSSTIIKSMHWKLPLMKPALRF